jgi:hypothetical protein
MHSLPVVEGKPVDDLVLGLTPCFKVHIVKPFDLQRTEKSFNLLFLEPLKSVSG